MTTKTAEREETKEVSTEMKMFMEERREQKAAMAFIGQAVLTGLNESGLDLEVLLSRCMEGLKELKEQNQEAANKDYFERLEESEGKPFVYKGHKFMENSDRRSFKIVGETAKQIKALKKEADEFNKKIKVLEAGAKASETDVKITTVENKVKFRISQLAPKTKPAA